MSEITPGGNPICDVCGNWHMIGFYCVPDPQTFEDLTTNWHNDPQGRELHEVLGMSTERYARWIVSPDDMRFEGENWCDDCPDREGCGWGIPCERAREVELQYQARKQAEADARSDDSGSGE